MYGLSTGGASSEVTFKGFAPVNNRTPSCSQATPVPVMCNELKSVPPADSAMRKGERWSICAPVIRSSKRPGSSVSSTSTLPPAARHCAGVMGKLSLPTTEYAPLVPDRSPGPTLIIATGCRTSDSEAFTDNSYSERSEEHTSELQSRGHLVCRLL